MRFARFFVLLLGFAFLYGPILILAAMSFNASKLVTVWGGFSTKWYVALLDDAAMLNAAKISLSVAALSAAIATLLGLAAAVALALVKVGRDNVLLYDGSLQEWAADSELPMTTGATPA